MRTAGASFNLTVKEERTGVAGKTTSFNSAGRTEQKNTPHRAGYLNNTVEGGEARRAAEQQTSRGLAMMSKAVYNKTHWKATHRAGVQHAHQKASPR